MTVAEPHTTFAAADGRVAVLWTHGRMTEHRRPGERAARVIARAFDLADAAAWAWEHGFDPIGLGSLTDGPPIIYDWETITGRDDVMANSKRGATAARGGPRPKGMHPDTVARNEHVLRLITEGHAAKDAIAMIAREYAMQPAAVSTSYYNWRRAELAAGRDIPKPQRADAAEPTPGGPDRDDPHAAPEPVASANGAHGVTPVIDDAPTPVDASARALEATLIEQWHAMQDGRRDLIARRDALRAAMQAAEDELLRIGEHELQVTNAAAALGVTLPAAPDGTP